MVAARRRERDFFAAAMAALSWVTRARSSFQRSAARRFAIASAKATRMVTFARPRTRNCMWSNAEKVG